MRGMMQNGNKRREPLEKHRDGLEEVHVSFYFSANRVHAKGMD